MLVWWTSKRRQCVVLNTSVSSFTREKENMTPVFLQNISQPTLAQISFQIRCYTLRHIFTSMRLRESHLLPHSCHWLQGDKSGCSQTFDSGPVWLLNPPWIQSLGTTWCVTLYHFKQSSREKYAPPSIRVSSVKCISNLGPNHSSCISVRSAHYYTCQSPPPLYVQKKSEWSGSMSACPILRIEDAVPHDHPQLRDYRFSEEDQ